MLHALPSLTFVRSPEHTSEEQSVTNPAGQGGTALGPRCSPPPVEVPGPPGACPRWLAQLTAGRTIGGGGLASAKCQPSQGRAGAGPHWLLGRREAGLLLSNILKWVSWAPLSTVDSSPALTKRGRETQPAGCGQAEGWGLIQAGGQAFLPWPGPGRRQHCQLRSARQKPREGPTQGASGPGKAAPILLADCFPPTSASVGHTPIPALVGRLTRELGRAGPGCVSDQILQQQRTQALAGKSSSGRQANALPGAMGPLWLCRSHLDPAAPRLSSQAGFQDLVTIGGLCPWEHRLTKAWNLPLTHRGL